MGRKRDQAAWMHRIDDFGGHTYFLKGKNLDMGGEKMISGELRKRDPNFGLCELMLIGGTVTQIVEDGKVIWKEGDNNPPERYDDDGKTLGDAIMTHLVTKVVPNIVDKTARHEECFGVYYDDTPEDEIGQATGNNANPTPSSVEFTGSEA